MFDMNEQLQQIIDKYSNIKENLQADLNEIAEYKVGETLYIRGDNSVYWITIESHGLDRDKGEIVYSHTGWHSGLDLKNAYRTLALAFTAEHIPGKDPFGWGDE